MTAGEFSPAARAAILEVGGGRCVGCGRPDVTTQHRRARGMGGTSDVGIGHPANGVPLCGDGVRGCHGWTEANPSHAALLGWRLKPGQPALGTPFFTRFGWQKWVMVDDDPAVAPCPGVAYVDRDDLDQLDDRIAAVRAYKLARPTPATNGHR